MHLDLIQSLSIAGDSSKANDDRAGAGHAHAWVIDGATDLGEPGLLGNRGGAAWIAAEADRAFAAAPEDGSIEQTCRTVFESVAAAFAEQRTRTPESWELPSASFLAVAIAGNVIDCAWLGDCAALLIRDGQATRIGPQRDIRDDETDLARSVAHHGLGSVKRAAPVLDVLRTARSRPDRLVLGVDPAGAEHIYYSSQPCVAGDELLLMSDGFAAVTDLYRLIEQTALPDLLAEGGLSGIAAQLRAAEAEDAECMRWPRFKQGDDATAIWLRVAA
jgi:serine/threonine protein phosphatase PrpC